MSISALATAGPLAGGTVLSLARGTLQAADRAEAVAKDFESLFLGEMLKQMRQTLDSGGLFGSDSGDVCGGLFDFFMGKHLADSGGLGLASYVRAQLQADPPR